MNKYTKQAQTEWLSGKGWEDKRAGEKRNWAIISCAILIVVEMCFILPALADGVLGL